jgi:hypothetical protein
LSHQQIRHLFASGRFTVQLPSVERVKGLMPPESTVDLQTDGRMAPTSTCSRRGCGPCVRFPSGGRSVVRRINLRMNRQRTGWSWITDGSYRSTVCREAVRLYRRVQYGQLSQLVGVNDGTRCIDSACCSSMSVVCDLFLAETSERA